jgi:hypothetical protein
METNNNKVELFVNEVKILSEILANISESGALERADKVFALEKSILNDLKNVMAQY